MRSSDGFGDSCSQVLLLGPARPGRLHKDISMKSPARNSFALKANLRMANFRLAALLLMLLFFALPLCAAPKRKTHSQDYRNMSEMGRLARLAALSHAHQPLDRKGKSFLARFDKFSPPEDDDADGPAGGQAEV